MANFDTLTARYDKKGAFQKAQDYESYLKYLGRISNFENFKKGITKIVALRGQIGSFVPEFKAEVNDNLLAMKTKKEAQKITSKLKNLEDQITFLDKVLKD